MDLSNKDQGFAPEEGGLADRNDLPMVDGKGIFVAQDAAKRDLVPRFHLSYNTVRLGSVADGS
jgi:hypothetical protein